MRCVSGRTGDCRARACFAQPPDSPTRGSLQPVTLQNAQAILADQQRRREQLQELRQNARVEVEKAEARVAAAKSHRSRIQASLASVEMERERLLSLHSERQMRVGEMSEW